MATGIIASGTANTLWRILEGATATNAAPSGSSAGVAIPTALGPLPSSTIVLVRSTAGSATMTVTIKLWGYSSAASQWFPLGIGADALKGVLNGGAAIGETGTDVIQHTEIVAGLFSFDRIYAEVVAIGGTSTAINVEALIGLVAPS